MGSKSRWFISRRGGPTVEGQLYMRVRGRVLGPYDQEKLQSLAKRGQLSRMHEVSTDGITWLRASKYPELFVAGPTTLTDEIAPQADGQTSKLAPPDVKPTWHYARQGAQHGPTDFAHLQSMVASGQITQDDLVWNEGMANWVPARQVSGLMAAVLPTVEASGDADRNVGSRSATDKLPATLCRSAVTSQAWVRFIEVVLFIYAATSLAGGFIFLIVGSRERSTTIVASGIFSFIHAGIAGYAAWLLLVYARQLGSLRQSPTSRNLERGLDALRGFWVLVSIVLIVVLAFSTVLVVWLFAVGVTFPGSF